MIFILANLPNIRHPFLLPTSIHPYFQTSYFPPSTSYLSPLIIQVLHLPLNQTSVIGHRSFLSTSILPYFQTSKLPYFLLPTSYLSPLTIQVLHLPLHQTSVIRHRSDLTSQISHLKSNFPLNPHKPPTPSNTPFPYGKY